MNIFKSTIKYYQMRKERNTYENKYNAANEELLKLYRKKSNLIDERDQYKDQATKFKEEVKLLKRTNMDLELELSKINQKLDIQNKKNELLVNKIKKIENPTKKKSKKYKKKPTTVINTKKSKKKEAN